MLSLAQIILSRVQKSISLGIPIRKLPASGATTTFQYGPRIVVFHPQAVAIRIQLLIVEASNVNIELNLTFPQVSSKSSTLAPFKLRFSMMSKSRNGGSEGSRSNSVECDEANQQQIDIQSLIGLNGLPDTPGANSNTLVIGNKPVVPNSPPPSYEHVLEETRLEQSAINTQEEKTEEDVEEKISDNEQSSGGGSADGERTSVKGPEILHKSSKELYRAVAKQWGITCKMSDHCRCFDCQSRYFDCEYEKDEQEKTDGGLGAGTPMFISGVMHGTACILL